MNIIIWGINYRPETTGIAPFNAELAEFLAGDGHAVTVVTGFAYYPHWRKVPADRGRLFARQQIRGVPVYRCAQYVPARVSTPRRMLHELSFACTSLFRVLLLPRADVYFVASPPLGLGVCAWVATRLKRSQYVFHVQDLQPGAAVGLGMVKGDGLIRLLLALEKFAYAKAAAVSGISPGMLAEFARKGVPAARRLYFPNWLRRKAEMPAPPGAFRRQFGFRPDEFLAVYSGNLGRKQGIGILLDAVRHLDGSAVVVIIAGAGAGREELAQRIAEAPSGNLRLLPLLSDADYARMLTDADVGLITQARGTGRFFFPSKLLTSLQARLPVITVADPESELARAVDEGGFGANVPPDDPAALATVLRQVSEDAVLRVRWQQRCHWVDRFRPGVVLPRFARRLEAIAAREGRADDLLGASEPSRL